MTKRPGIQVNLMTDSKSGGIFGFFHRCLGLIYLVALIPLYFELPGLIGSNGLLPADILLERAYTDKGLFLSLMQFPSLYHIYPSDITLFLIVTIGVFGAVLLLIGKKTFVGAIAAWVAFLSITTIGGDFFVIIIDLFLAEVGFLSLFSTYSLQSRNTIPKLVRWVFLMLNFKLWFCMGVNKFYLPLEIWTSFEFFNQFFQAQPMPTPFAPLFHQVPNSLKAAATIGLFVGEVIVPFAVFGGKKLRLLSFWTFVVISVLIQINGNYGFFNVLSIALALTILKDADLPKFFKQEAQSRITAPVKAFPLWTKAILVWHLLWQLTYCIYIFDTTPYSHQNHFNIMFNTWKVDSDWEDRLYEPFRWIGYWRLCNPYGVFKGIPKYHGEIRFSGSSDGKVWKEYEFKYLPSGKTDHLGFFAPYYPRLDHLMFYETLSESNHKHNPLNQYNDFENAWTCQFIDALINGNEDVTDLLRFNPFDSIPPTLIQTKVYRLAFATPYTGKHWESEEMTGMNRIYSADSCIAPLITYQDAMHTVGN